MGYLYTGGLMTSVEAFEDYGARLGRLLSAASETDRLRHAAGLLRTLPPERKSQRERGDASGAEAG